MLVLADFLLDSDLCLRDGAAPITIRPPNSEFSITISNATAADRASGDVVLSGQLTFNSDVFDKTLRAVALEKLGSALNLLVFTTRRKLALTRLKQIIDWTPGLTDRRAFIYAETPEWEIATPGFSHLYADTIERLLAMDPMVEQQSAMRWFRRGIEATTMEDQFSYFWFSLEIAAEALKGPERVPSKCPKCKSPLYCEQCRTHPEHRRYPGEAIRQVVERFYPKTADEMFEPLQLIRHTLMHGGRVASLVGKLPGDAQSAVNIMAYVSWHAILLMFRKLPPDQQPISVGYKDQFVHQTIVGTADMTIRMPGDPNNPKIEDFPAVDVKINRAATPSADKSGLNEREGHRP
jgi:hypothetical protein